MTLATEFVGGGNREYTAHVDLETWIGAGGSCGASAQASATVEQIVIRVI